RPRCSPRCPPASPPRKSRSTPPAATRTASWSASWRRRASRAARDRPPSTACGWTLPTAGAWCARPTPRRCWCCASTPTARRPWRGSRRSSASSCWRWTRGWRCRSEAAPAASAALHRPVALQGRLQVAAQGGVVGALAGLDALLAQQVGVLGLDALGEGFLHRLLQRLAFGGLAQQRDQALAQVGDAELGGAQCFLHQRDALAVGAAQVVFGGVGLDHG